jgi:hypothetical protein
MVGTKEAWDDAGRQLSDLGRRLRQHYEQQRGTAGDQAKADVEDAVKKLADAVQDAFEALGAAAKDQAVKDDVKHAARSLTDAFGASFADLSEEVRTAFQRRREAGGSGSAGREPGPGPGPGPTGGPTGGGPTDGAPRTSSPTD